jgi:hypothetical protein
VAGENARKNEHAWRDRAEESSAHQAAAAGMGPPPGLGGPRTTGTGGRGTPVYVTGASENFINQFNQTWGSTPGGQGTGEGRNALDPVLDDHRAIGEAARQMAEDLQISANIVLREQGNAARAMTSLAQDMRTIRQEERDHMQGLLDLLASQSTQQLQVANAIQAAYAGIPVHAAVTPPTTSGSPTPRRARQGAGAPVGAYSTPTGIVTVGPGGGAGGGRGRGAGHPGRPHPTTLRSMRRNLFNTVNQRYGVPAAATAGMPPSTMQRAVSSFASPMASVGLRGVPVLGAGLAIAGGVVDAMDWLTDQRKQNAEYQQIYSGDNFGLSDTIQGLFGGDANTGSGQRAAGFNFRMSQMFSHGGMAGEDADRLFRGVSALGYNNDQRRDQLRFATGLYKREGMGVDDSLQLINVSARYANQSLAGVAQGLQSVSKAAQQTGQSAKSLRDLFTNYYGSALAGGAGSSAGTIAQAMTLSTAGMSRQLAGANMSPMLSNPMYMQQIASGAGMTSGQMQSQMAQGNPMPFAHSAQKILDQRMMGVMAPSVRTKFTGLVKEYGGNKAVAEGPGAISRIATELMGDSNWNVYAARSALQSIGVDTSQMNDQQVTEFYVAQMTSGGLEAQTKEQQAKNNQARGPGRHPQRGDP